MGEYLGLNNDETLPTADSESRDRGNLLFVDVIKSLPAEEQKLAEPYLDLYRRKINLEPKGQEEILDAIVGYCESLPEEKLSDLRRSGIFNFLIGSSQTRREWENTPLLSSDGEFENFINTTIAEIIVRHEQGNN